MKKLFFVFRVQYPDDTVIFETYQIKNIFAYFESIKLKRIVKKQNAKWVYKRFTNEEIHDTKILNSVFDS